MLGHPDPSTSQRVTAEPVSTSFPGAATADAPVVIVGTGLAGWTTAREFRKRDTRTPILMVTTDRGDFYAKPSLSNAFAQGRTPAQLVTTEAAPMCKALNVRLRAHTPVERIDPQARSIVAGSETLIYRDLVLATGAQPIRVPLAGQAAHRVLSVNSLDDFAMLHAVLRPAAAKSAAAALHDTRTRRVVIMGAGLIGCEFANDLVRAGYPVTVVDPGARVLSGLLPAGASTQLQQALGNAGVQWRFGCTVCAVNPLRPDCESLELTLSDGNTVHAEVVLSAIGLRAGTALAQASGLACERGILVDDHLRTSAAHIHALGDAAQYAAGLWDDGTLSGGVTLPYVMPIMAAARTLAAHLAGEPVRLSFGAMPVSIKTPALPVVALPAPPSVAGGWESRENGVWQFMDDVGRPRGFVLTGAKTSGRAEHVRLIGL